MAKTLSVNDLSRIRLALTHDADAARERATHLKDEATREYNRNEARRLLNLRNRLNIIGPAKLIEEEEV